MAKNVVGLFDTRNDAEAAVRDLRDAGFPSNDISFVGNNANNQYTGDTGYSSTTGDSEAAEGAGFGATGGAVLGGLAGLLVGLGALAIPGIGPVVAAGTLATALGSTALGAGLGAAAGGLVGALVGAGIPENDANVYAEGIRRGGALVSVQVATDDEANRAADIMDRHNVVDIDERGGTYRQSGWSGFSDNDTSYSGSDYGSTRAVGSTGDADTTIGTDDYNRSSKIGTAGGGLAGAAAGAAIGSAGGPVGTVVGGIAGAVTGGGIGAAGDAAGAEATDDHADHSHSHGMDSSRGMSGTDYGSARTISGNNTTDTGFNTTNTGFNNTNMDQAGEVKIPIVEEELRVGKREVESGGVRVNTRIEETPVNEQVTLREETVDVHRKPVDRPLGDADLSNFQEGSFEVRERSEQAIVDKQARVVEEVHIKKNVEERTETIQDTVRRTDVDVDQIGTERSVGYTDTNYTDTTGTTGTTGFNQTGGTNEGTIERGTSNLGNSVERGLGTDIDRDGDVGQRDPRNNY
jgi:uncharacterized protein (TIGR02271 family)